MTVPPSGLSAKLETPQVNGKTASTVLSCIDVRTTELRALAGALLALANADENEEDEDASGTA